MSGESGRSAAGEPTLAPHAVGEGSPGLPARRFVVDGLEWTARIAGETAGGTGRQGVAALVVVHFSRAGREQAERELLLPRGRIEELHDQELCDLFRTARAVTGTGVAAGKAGSTRSPAEDRPSPGSARP